MNARRPASLRTASTHGSVAISSHILERLRDHATQIGQPMSAIVDELVDDYLDVRGVWAEIGTHLATINALGRELEDLAQRVRRIVDCLPRFARNYDVGPERMDGSDPHVGRCTAIEGGARCTSPHLHGGRHVYSLAEMFPPRST